MSLNLSVRDQVNPFNKDIETQTGKTVAMPNAEANSGDLKNPTVAAANAPTTTPKSKYIATSERTGICCSLVGPISHDAREIA